MNFTLENNTQAFIKALEAQGGKPLYTLTPVEARAVLEKVQSSPIDNPEVQIEKLTIPGPKGNLVIHIFRPTHSTERLPVIMYFHGAGWVMGSLATHEHLVRELAVGTQSAVVFVTYSRSPEARFPVAIEELYAATQYIAEKGEALNLDTSKLSVAGDSVGGNMAIAVTMLAKERKGPTIFRQVLFYPVTNGEMNTPSYQQFANGPWLTKPAMEWFWNAYQPDKAARKQAIISPLLATLEQLKGLPPALIITDENDVLRDEGELYASKLMQAGVDVTATRFLGTIHDFLMIHALAHTPAARGALALTFNYLNDAYSRLAQKKPKARKKAA